MRPANAVPFDRGLAFAAWSISDDGTRVTLYWPGSAVGDSVGTLMFHIADQPDAVHVLVTRSPEPPPRPPTSEVGPHMDDVQYQRAELRLPSPLGTRWFVDATAGRQRPRVATDRDYRQSVRDDLEGRRRRPVEPGQALRWNYEADDHRVIQFVRPPGHPDESRRVSFRAADRRLVHQTLALAMQ